MVPDKLGTQLGELMISSLLLHLFKPLLYFISRYFPVTFFSNLISGHSHCQLCHADGFSCSTSYRVTSTWIKSPIDSRKPSDCSSIRHVLFHNFIANIGSRKSCSNCMELIQVSPFQLMAFVNDLSYTHKFLLGPIYLNSCVPSYLHLEGWAVNEVLNSCFVIDYFPNTFPWKKCLVFHVKLQVQ